MATLLEEITVERLQRRLEAAGCTPVPAGLARALHAHYEELRRWAPRLALVGPAESGSIVERHYAESLRALPFLDGASAVLDLGSGAGFPGIVLAAARPDIDFWLVESRSRKAAFLRSAAARAELSCRVVDARVAGGRPVTAAVPGTVIDLVTVRGLKVDRQLWMGLRPALAADARFLRWEGATAVAAWPEATRGRTIRLPGIGRTIQEWLYSPDS